MSSIREETHLRGESKEGIIEAILPQRAPFDKEEGIWITLCLVLAETGIYFDSFWEATGRGEKINWHS